MISSCFEGCSLPFFRTYFRSVPYRVSNTGDSDNSQGGKMREAVLFTSTALLFTLSDNANAAMEQFRSDGKMDYVPAYDPSDENAAVSFELDYYANADRGAVPEWENKFAVASWSEWLELNAIDGV